MVMQILANGLAYISYKVNSLLKQKKVFKSKVTQAQAVFT